MRTSSWNKKEEDKDRKGAPNYTINKEGEWKEVGGGGGVGRRVERCGGGGGGSREGEREREIHTQTDRLNTQYIQRDRGETEKVKCDGKQMQSVLFNRVSF